jgi:DNA polymerase (family 10)
VIRAIENPHVDILFHPNGRQLGRRAAIDIDMDAVIAAAARTGTILEINAQPERLDLIDIQVRRAREAGVKLAINSDTHNVGDLRFPRLYGVYVARRGWATRADIINTLAVERMLASLKPRQRERPRRAVTRKRRPAIHA